MLNITQRLEDLKICLGEKKLKQLGLIPCSTCIKIMSQAANISLPSDLSDKSYLTPEDMAAINESIMKSASKTINVNLSGTPQDVTDNLSDNEFSGNVDNEVTDNINTSNDTSTNNTDASEDINNTSIDTLNPINNEDNTSDDDTRSSDNEDNISNDNTSSSNTEDNTSNNTASSSENDNTHIENPVDETASSDSSEIETESVPLTHTITSEDDLLKTLMTIIKNSHRAAVDDEHSIGYIYTQPNIPLPHSLSCSECGRLYTIAHPTLELLPLPVYLTDTEYEMLKGVYVDILL